MRDRRAGHDALVAVGLLEMRPLGRTTVHGEEHARWALIGVMPGVWHRAWRFHVRPQRPLVVCLGQRRDERHELRHEDERAADAPEPIPATGRGRGSSHHMGDINDTTVRPASL